MLDYPFCQSVSDDKRQFSLNQRDLFLPGKDRSCQCHSRNKLTGKRKCSRTPCSFLVPEKVTFGFGRSLRVMKLTAILTFSVLLIFRIDPGARLFINAHSMWPDLSHSWKPSIPRSSGPFEIPKVWNQAIISDWKGQRIIVTFFSICLPHRNHYTFQLFSVPTHATVHNLGVVKPFFLFLFNICR